MTRPGAALVLVLLVPLAGGWGLLRSKNDDVERGNAELRAGRAAQALELYDKAAAKLPSDPAVRFNRGAALFGLGRFGEAAQEFLRATEVKDARVKAAAFYNLGNAFFRAEKYREAVEAYKRSLAIAPGDLRAKWNLELALRKKKEQDEKRQKEGESGKDGDPPKPDGEDQAKQDQAKQDQASKPPEDAAAKPQDQPSADPGKDNEGPPDKAEGEGNDKDEPKGAEPPTGGDSPADRPASHQEIDAVLDSLEKSPKNLERERARLRAVRRRPPERDW